MTWNEGEAYAFAELEEQVRKLERRVCELEDDAETPADPNEGRCDAITTSGDRCSKDGEFELDTSPGGTSLYCKQHARLFKDGRHSDEYNAAEAEGRRARYEYREWERGRADREADERRRQEAVEQAKERRAANRRARLERMGEERCAAMVKRSGGKQTRCEVRRIPGRTYCRYHRKHERAAQARYGEHLERTPAHGAAAVADATA